MVDLKGKVAIIAGAAGGLGGAASAAFAKSGANLVLLGRSLDKLDELASQLKLQPESVLTQAANVSDAKEVDVVAAEVMKKFGRIDILLNFVGGWIGGKVVGETSKEDLDSMLDQHLYSSYAMIKAFVPEMQKNKWGRVLAVSSPNAGRPPGKNSPYAIGKSAMETLMLSLAQELKGTGVTSNLVLVRMIDTAHKKVSEPNEENRNWTTPEEISATLLALCGDAGAMINGARIPLFGEPL